jgi:integrase
LLAEAPAQRLSVYWARHNFRALCQQCGLNAHPPPRLHDLRHNYACQCLAQWREAGEDVHAMLPVLAHAMGHVGIHSTQLYLHTGPLAFRQASATFHRFATLCSEQSQ